MLRLRLVAQGVAANSSAAVVRRELAAARVLAAAALRRDGRWAGLSGGVAALDEAVEADDGAVAGPALAVALRECGICSVICRDPRELVGWIPLWTSGSRRLEVGARAGRRPCVKPRRR